MIGRLGRRSAPRRKIESTEPVLSRSREVILRGAHGIVVVQVVVTKEENLKRISGELLEISRSFEQWR